MEGQKKQFKLDENNYFDYVVNGDILEITLREFDAPTKLIQWAISLAQEAKLKYIIGETFANIFWDGGVFENSFSGTDAVDRMNRVEFSADKERWYKVGEKGGEDQRKYFRYRVYYK